MNGFILVDKPKGMTSFAVVSKIKRELSLKKCGHSGTLDPNTTGLLIIACNQATKLLKYVLAEDKVYLATICFGFDSNTLDIDGNITKDIPMDFKEEELDSALESMKSKKTQLPPLVSAIKVNGKKLYEYERKRIEVEVKERSVLIYELTRLSNLRCIDGHLEVDLRIHCSKGFYVRSFARDLGKLLGGCAILKELRRLASGKFRVEDSIKLEEVKETKLKSIAEVFSDFPKVEVSPYLARLVASGIVLDERQAKLDTPFYVTCKEEVLAIYEPVESYRYKPVLLFEKGEDYL